MNKRLVPNSRLNDHGVAVLEHFDDIQEHIEYSDKEVTQSQAKATMARLDELAEFEREMKAAVDDFALSKEAAKKKAKEMGSAKGKLPTEMSQAEAKRMIPPGTSIWRGRTGSGSWQGHCPPFKRCYYNFKTMGETQAMKAVIKQLWRQYIKLNALPESAVPFDLDD